MNKYLVFGLMHVAGIAFIASGASCMSAGRDFSMTKADKIVEGVTTKAEVRRLLGEPNTMAKTAQGAETWVYSHASFGPYTGRSKAVCVSFDNRGIVVIFSKSDTNVN